MSALLPFSVPAPPPGPLPISIRRASSSDGEGEHHRVGATSGKSPSLSARRRAPTQSDASDERDGEGLGWGPRLTAACYLPTLNEEAAIGPAVRELRTEIDRLAARGLPVDIERIIIVDNGSTDGTAAAARAAGATVVTEPQRGYGRACASGVLACGDVDLVVQLDGDGSDDPADLAALLAPIVDGSADLVIGSRILGHADRGALQVQQRFGNWLATRLLRLRYGLRVTDVGPFRVIRRDQLLSLGMTEMTYGWSTEMMARAARRGLRVREVPVSYRVRAGGESKVSGNLRASIRAGERILGTVFRSARDRPDAAIHPFPVPCRELE